MNHEIDLARLLSPDAVRVGPRRRHRILRRAENHIPEPPLAAEAIKTMIDQGLSAQRICTALGIEMSRLRRLAKARGWRFRGNANRNTRGDQNGISSSRP